MSDRPKIICLCGSTRFSEAFRKANLDLTLHGHIVLTVGCDTKSDDGLGLGPDVKKRLDDLHLRKIDLADGILVLNVGGYIGESTRRELAYAIAMGKEARFLEPEAGEMFMQENTHLLGRLAADFALLYENRRGRR